jgi:hypothetical protein
VNIFDQQRAPKITTTHYEGSRWFAGVKGPAYQQFATRSEAENWARPIAATYGLSIFRFAWNERPGEGLDGIVIEECRIVKDGSGQRRVYE